MHILNKIPKSLYDGIVVLFTYASLRKCEGLKYIVNGGDDGRCFLG